MYISVYISPLGESNKKHTKNKLANKKQKKITIEKKRKKKQKHVN